MTKTCSKCKETKQIEEFQKRAKNSDGYAGMCKQCKRSYDNEHYRLNEGRREYIRANSKKRRLAVQDWLISYFESHPCVDCGENDIIVLEFDHRGDKVTNISDMLRSYSLEAVKIEVEKCDVRCCNCHRRKTARTLGSWRMPL